MKKIRTIHPPAGAMFLFTCSLAGVLALSGCRKEPVVANGDPEKFTYLTEVYPPFNYAENGQANGVSVDILDAVFQRLNLTIDRSAIQVADWAGAYETTRSTPGTMLFSMVRTTQRDTLFKWVGPIAPHNDVAISLKGSAVVIDEVTDLNECFTGVIEGYSSITNLMDQGVYRTNIVIYPDLAALYKALVTDREVQFISYSEAGHYLAIQAMGYAADLFNNLFPIHSDELYYAFNRETADALITSFQEQLNKIKTDKSVDGSSDYEKIFNRYRIIQYATDGLTSEQVIALVNRTAADLEADAAGTIAKVNQGLAPYKDPVNKALYSFLYDTDVVMIAHADNPSLVGSSFAGKPDAAGKKFRDDIIRGALENGTGWVDYVYTKPDQSGLYHKTTYYKLVTASNSTKYVVCAGKFR